jgi:hypothetical protein
MAAYSSTIHQVRHAPKEPFGDIYSWFDQPEEVRSHKPLHGGWSINEILEPSTLTTHFLLIVARNGYPKAIKREQAKRIEESESDSSVLSRIGQRGSFPWIRPEHREPKGRPMSEVLVMMRQQPGESLDILAKVSSGEGSLFKVRTAVNNAGKMDSWQWLCFIAQHAKRHIGQMDDCPGEQQKLSAPR